MNKPFVPVLGSPFSVKKDKRGWSVFIDGTYIKSFRYFYSVINAINKSIQEGYDDEVHMLALMKDSEMNRIRDIMNEINELESVVQLAANNVIQAQVALVKHFR